MKQPRAVQLASAIALTGLLGLSTSPRAQNILNNSDHIAQDAYAAVQTLGVKTGAARDIHVDQTCATDSAGNDACSINGVAQFVPPTTLISDATNPSAVLYPAGASHPMPDNHAPYAVLNQSSGGYTLAADQGYYAAIEAAKLVYVMAYCGTPAQSDYPPLGFATVLPNIATAGAANRPGCGYAQGIEFSIPVDASVYGQCIRGPPNNPVCRWTPYPGAASLAMESPSATTEALSGVMAVLKHNHPSWSWGDVKGALRQTASCWTRGYAVSCGSGPQVGFGYGNIHFIAANSIHSTNSIYLQPPGMQVSYSAGTNSATFKLYPFRQTRRVKEVIYLGGTWPSAASGCGGDSCNEYTAAQVAAAGGQLIYSSNGTDVTPMFTYPLPASLQHSEAATPTFVALTLDADGNGSRVESFMQGAIDTSFHRVAIANAGKTGGLPRHKAPSL